MNEPKLTDTEKKALIETVALMGPFGSMKQAEKIYDSFVRYTLDEKRKALEPLKPL